MAVQRVVATMSSAGFVSGITDRLDRLFAYWLTSAPNQSYVLGKSIHSFQKLIQQYDGDADRLAQAVENDLSAYLTGEFDRADIKCTPLYPSGSEATTKFYHLKINVIVYLGSTAYDVGNRLFELNNGIFKQITQGL